MKHPAAFPVGLGLEFGPDRQLREDEDAQPRVLAPVLGESASSWAVLATSSFSDRIDEEGRVEADHQRSSRTG